MLQVLRIGPYSVYFWSNENDPLVLRKLMKVIEANTEKIIAQWLECFGEIKYFC